ncbi:DUF1622 domain-containing protein [Oryzihumus sp.]|jgi:uncharacterized membrane protein|uniref:DUF1622 domain-containing protein n=1 Tax=Oryzihumus sp. TaxID=1968903 RepID=UPI002ED97545
MSFTTVVDDLVKAVEAVAAAELVVGLVWAAVVSWGVWRRTREGRTAYRQLRESLGGVLLLALELLVVADLLRTVALQPTLSNLAGLGLLVLIRTFLSFALETEIEGVAPWRRWQVSGATRLGQAQRRARDAG